METVNVGPVQPVQLVYASPFPAAGPSPKILLFNNDITRPVYAADNETIDTGSVQIPPLAAVTVDGDRDMFGSTLGNGTVQVYRIPGGTTWSASPAQIAAQINALGLAKDTSVNAPAYGPITTVNPGTLSKDTTTNNIHTDLSLGTNLYLGGSAAGALTAFTGKSIAQDMLAAQSGVTTELAGLLQPHMTASSGSTAAAGSITLFTPGSNARVWAVVVTLTGAGTPTAGGTAQAFISDTSALLNGLVIDFRCNNALAIPSFAERLVFCPTQPIPIPSGDAVSLTLNVVAGPTFIARGTVYWSTP